MESEFEVPLGHTAWWSFTGTGAEVTVDTAGSSFDSVVGVYIDDGGILTRSAATMTSIRCRRGSPCPPTRA